MIYTTIGIDNGCSGSIAVIGQTILTEFIMTPVIQQQNYATKKVGKISRLNYPIFYAFLKKYDPLTTFVIIERPMINPTRFMASLSAIRTIEPTVVAIESLGFPYEVMDSKEWQKVMLPKGIKGSPDLKKSSLDAGIRLFPQFSELITKHGDADSLLMASYDQMKRIGKA